MKGKVYRLLSLVCAGALVASCFTGCKNEGNESADSTEVALTEEQVPLAKEEEETSDAEEEAVETPAEEEQETATEETTTTTRRTTRRTQTATQPTVNVVGGESGNESSGSSSSAPAVRVDKTVGNYDYHLVWSDEFKGDKLDRNSWNVEVHGPGWVNEEWQAYVDAEGTNFFVKDGALHIKPVKTVDADGNASYTSGRVNTMGKQDFLYGYFECKAKVPAGKGYLPAFWMMPTDENFYGQWPICGEVDIMEVMGQDTKTAYGTVHYGAPHAESQGKNVLTEGDYSSEYHTYAVDWEPGKITWYIDGVKYHEENDWYCTTENQGTVTYPAPFDQQFYMILNLAVGGSWVGYPDSTTDFDNQEFAIDYVKVYQRNAGYNEEGLVAPVKPAVSYRDPDASGNYIMNGNFMVEDKLDGTENYEFLLAGAGKGKAEIVSTDKFSGTSKAIKITTENAGELDYSVQLVQADVPLVRGGKYRISFDAYADENRTIIADISAPFKGWKRYFADTKVDLTGEVKTYTFDIDMNDDSDAQARMEFNLGNQGATATVYISNIRVEKTGEFEVKDELTACADGNYIHNGDFDEGENRLGYWTVEGALAYKVPANYKARRLEVTTASTEATVTQKDLPVAGDVAYAFSFEAANLDGAASRVIKVSLLGEEYEFTVTGDKNTTYSKVITSPATITDKDIKFIIPAGSKVALDSVKIVEDSLIKNGSFNAGEAGFELYVNSPAKAKLGIDSLTEGNHNAAEVTITDTGADDDGNNWYIQLKQTGVHLEEGQWYRFKFNVKSDYARKIMYAFQQDGNKTGNWTQYCQDTITLAGDKKYVTIVKDFQMIEPSDAETILSFTMGSVGGGRITDQHIVTIDDISLEKISEPKPVIENNLITNALFRDGLTGWEASVANWDSSVHANAEFIPDIDGVKAVIKDAGDANWHVQLKQKPVELVKGATYKLYFDVTSNVDRTINAGIQRDGSSDNDWTVYSNTEKETDAFVLEAGKELRVEREFTMQSETDDNAILFFTLGKIDENTPKEATIVINHIGLVQTGGEGYVPPVEEEKPALPAVGDSLLKNADFSQGLTGWEKQVANWGGDNPPYADAEAEISTVNNGVKFDIKKVGNLEWHVQVKQTGLPIEKGAQYMLKFDVTSTVTRKFEAGVQGGDKRGYHVYSGNNSFTVTEGETLKVEQSFTMQEDDDLDSLIFFSLGKINDDNTPASTVVISNVSLVKTAEAPGKETGSESSGSTDVVIDTNNLLTNGNFTNGTTAWNTGIQGTADATVAIKEGALTYTIADTGSQEWHIQLTQGGVTLEEGCKYKLSFDIESSTDRPIKSNILDPSTEPYGWYLGGEVNLTANEPKHVEFWNDITVTKENLRFDITLGNMGGENKTPGGEVKISNIKLEKVVE